MLKRWRRLDGPGLEVLSLIEDAGGMTARSVIIDGGDKAFGMTADGGSTETGARGLWFCK